MTKSNRTDPSIRYYPKDTVKGDWIKYLPLAILAVSFVSGWATLKAQAAGHDEKIKAIEVVQAKMSGDIADVRVSQAKSEAQLTAILDAVKDLKRK